MNCVFCNEEEEAMQHTFFSRKVTSQVWNIVHGWIGLIIVLASTTDSCLFSAACWFLC